MTFSQTFQLQEVQTGNSETGYTEIVGADAWKNRTFVTKGASNLLMAMNNVTDE